MTGKRTLFRALSEFALHDQDRDIVAEAIILAELGGMQRDGTHSLFGRQGRRFLHVRYAIRVRCTVVIKPEARRQIYWTMVPMDALVSIGATSTSSLERFVAA
jgi:hypothetical protein